MEIQARKIPYRLLNKMVRDAVSDGKRDVKLIDINGQRYIGDGLKGDSIITVHGTAGNDLAAFLDGPTVVVRGNAQDGVGNTMNSGKVIIHGEAGDIVGYGMRGGKIFIRSNVGYRAGIHMKSYEGKVPIVVVGGRAGDFFGEYMAGGILILLGLEKGEKPIVGDYCATGIHGGAIFIRGEVNKHSIGQEAAMEEPTSENMETLRVILSEYCSDFGLDLSQVMSERFLRLYPYSSRPYGRLYAY